MFMLGVAGVAMCLLFGWVLRRYKFVEPTENDMR